MNHHGKINFVTVWYIYCISTFALPIINSLLSDRKESSGGILYNTVSNVMSTILSFSSISSPIEHSVFCFPRKVRNSIIFTGHTL